ncbi:relaxase/mobilization nuclease domain-containing protein [Qipengyuania sp. GH1]|uniref:relaxase/mobilization nuclease domain-containing protein n=1 Tax=Qipengyuania aestuarii TaxID=2867241 RepID=UPI001C87D1AF|nr:relaxase/mobilization nuclease domain-containing protein [Qipengyuania aestuarii]MBX7536228.1 relaxase/mobilization nuclease domain-containing protein [Qipengyuania aestuarii]
MTIYHKCESPEASRATDISRLRGKTSALIHYVWRADLKALARASMESAINSYHQDLMRYVRRDEHREEVAATLVRNVLTDNPDMMSAEMAALMEEADAGDGVVEHVIVSVQQGDDLLGNFEEAVEILVEALGVGKCPVIGAVHSDTDYDHFHLIIVRVDIETGEIVSLPHFDIIRGHQAMAVMEDRFDWQREENARWQVVDGRLILDGTTDVGPAHDPRQWPDGYFHHPEISAAGRKVERQHGYVSAERLVRKVVPELITQHSDQPSFLAALAKHGIELRRAHRGAAYLVHSEDQQGNKRIESVKASVVRGWGWKALERKYGKLAVEDSQVTRSPQSQPIDGEPGRPKYATAKSRYQDRLNAMMRNVRSSLPGGPDYRAGLLAARTACAFPTYDEWTSGALPPDIGEVLFTHVGARILEGGRPFASSPRNTFPDQFYGVRSLRNRDIYYRRGSEPGCKIVDFGRKVVLVGRASDEEMRKALTLLSVRGATVVSGSGFSDREIRRAQKLASDLGVVVIRHDAISQIAARSADSNFKPNNEMPTSVPISVETNNVTDNKTIRRGRGADPIWSGSDLTR